MPQSLAGYIRQHLDEIEERMEYGTSQAEIVVVLHQLGYQTTLGAFRNYLARARSWRNKKQHASVKENRPVSSPAQPAPKPVPENPLTKPAGFEWEGTMNEQDLI